MKKIIYILTFFVFVLSNTYAQVGINTIPDDNAILHVESTNLGVLFPRIQLQRVDTQEPLEGNVPDGTIVFNKSDFGSGSEKILKGYYTWYQNKWRSLLLYETNYKVAKYSPAASNPSFNFNAGESNVPLFVNEEFNDDAEVFAVLSPESLQLKKTGKYLITLNLGLKNYVNDGSRAEAYMQFYLNGAPASTKLLTKAPQQRAPNANINNKFVYSMTDYIIVDAAPAIIQLRTTRNNPSNDDNEAISFDDGNNASSITILFLDKQEELK